MRINLKVPFAQKDAAKALGARWDAARKIWYVIDPEAIEIFSDWMPEAENSAVVQDAPPPKAKTSPGFVTGAKTFMPSCACKALPWEHCEHSRSLTPT